MIGSKAIARVGDYWRRHGLRSTILRAGLAGKRAFFARGMVVFYCDLVEATLRHVSIPNGWIIEQVRSLGELREDRLQAITSFWSPKLANQNVRQRFDKGATLWLAECDGQLAGFGWTLQGGTIEPYYFPLTQQDVHLFDFHVFPQFRGQGINPLLVAHLLVSLAKVGARRAFIEAAVWNHAQLSSLEKTQFRRLGVVKSCTFFRRRFVFWREHSKAFAVQRRAKPGSDSQTPARNL